MRNLRPLFSALLFLLSAIPMSATVYVVPHDDEMIDDADGIIIGRVHAMNGQFALNGDINTVIDLDVEEVLKGTPTQTMRIMVPGGVVGTQIMGVSDGPVFWDQERTLLFVGRDASGNFTSFDLALGKFDFAVDTEGNPLAVRYALAGDTGGAWDVSGHPHFEPLRNATSFIKYIRKRVSGGHPASDYVQDPGPFHPTGPPAGTRSMLTPQTGVALTPATDAFPPSAYTQGNFRWDVFDNGGSVTFFVSGNQPGYDSIGAAQRALGAWTNDPGSNVRYLYGGTNNAGFVQDGVNTIVYNDSADVPAGAIAYSKWFANAQHTYKGEIFNSNDEGDVVVKSNFGFSQLVLDEAVCHELGHTLGFRHSDQGTPSSTDAVMKAVLNGTLGANLHSWDIEAVDTVYTSSAPAPVSITSLTASPASPQPEGTSITFTATATGGTAPLQYRFWRQDNGSWSIVRDYTSSNTYTWVTGPGSAGSHQIEVDVRSSGSTAAYEAVSAIPYTITAGSGPVTSLSISANKASPQPEGSAITFTAVAGGSSNPQYRFWRQDNGSWSIVQDYSSSSTYTWTPAPGSAGSHQIEVDARTVGETVAYDKVATMPFTITSPRATVTSLTASPASPQPEGTSITFTATASGGTAPLQYRFWRQDNGSWGIVRDYSTSNTYTWVTGPGSAGSHQIEVDVRSAGSTAAYESVMAIPYTIAAKATVTSLTASPASPQRAGTTITFTATASGGVGPLQYRFWRQDNGSWGIVRDYSTSNTWTWSTTSASVGLHQIEVDVRSAGSTAAYESVAAIPYTINP